jgi:signal transduction histidine kinase
MNDEQPAARSEIDRLRADFADAQRDIRGYRDLLLAASHEMRTPLHAIGLHLEMLTRLAGGENESAQKAQIERAKRVLEGYVRRTSMLLDTSRVASGVFKLHIERVPLKALISSVVELYAAKAAFQKAPVTLDVAAGIVGQWDRGAVETIVANLFPRRGCPKIVHGLNRFIDAAYRKCVGVYVGSFGG